MTEKEKQKDKVYDVWERIYPLLWSVIITSGYLLLRVDFKDSFSDLLSASMSFASIMLGFVGVLIALLFSLNGNVIKDHIFQDEGYKARMNAFFRTPIHVGFCFIIFSLVMYLKNTLLGIECIGKVIAVMMEFVKVLWIFLLVWFITSTYRLLRIVLQIAFNGERESQEGENEEDVLDKELYEKAKLEHAAAEEKTGQHP